VARNVAVWPDASFDSSSESDAEPLAPVVLVVLPPPGADVVAVVEPEAGVVVVVEDDEEELQAVAPRTIAAKATAPPNRLGPPRRNARNIKVVVIRGTSSASARAASRTVK
jgi:hypothetical protein